MRWASRAARGAGAYESRFSRFRSPQTARTAASVASAVAATFFNKISTSRRNCRGSPPSLNPVKASVRLPSTNDLVHACSAKGSIKKKCKFTHIDALSTICLTIFICLQDVFSCPLLRSGLKRKSPSCFYSFSTQPGTDMVNGFLQLILPFFMCISLLFK